MGQSEQNRVRKISLADYRGEIKDRLGNIIVNVRPSFSLYVTPEDADNLSESLEFLSGLIEINKDGSANTDYGNGDIGTWTIIDGNVAGTVLSDFIGSMSITAAVFDSDNNKC